MWKLYHCRHLWVFLSLICSSFNYLSGSGEGTPQEPLHSPHGPQLLETGSPNVTLGVGVACVPPSIDEFPDDFLTPEQRLNGGILLHALVVVYVCCMLAIVCDRYFVPSLKVISEHFNVPSDIAGATFMAIGTSSPELFSSVIGVFVAEGDIGVGTVVGSAVFNILAVTGASGIAVGVLAVQLDWYPITRDCFIYIITISSLVFVIHDNVVTWVEASILLSMFVGYLIILYFNDSLKKVVTSNVKSLQSVWNEGNSDEFKKHSPWEIDETSPLVIANGFPSHYRTYDDSACPSSENSSSLLTDSDTVSDTLDKESFSGIVVENYVTNKNAEGIYIIDSKCLSGDSFEESAEFSLWSLPPTKLGKLFWLLMWPANLLFRFTIPNCETPENLKWFPLTFFTSVIWLGALSYISFWMVAIIGNTLGIPDTVSGLTILAAGTSIPELVASVIVVKKGLGNMAMCNLISSNIFDILFCLGGPWLIKAALNVETRSVVVHSSALTYTTLILLAAVVLFYLSLAAWRWRLHWRMGLVALTLYATFLVLACLYESNFFGDFNPPTCPPAS